MGAANMTVNITNKQLVTRFKKKTFNYIFLSYKHLAYVFLKIIIDGPECCGLVVDYCDVFYELSF